MRLLVATAVSVALVFGSLSMVSAAEDKKPIDHEAPPGRGGSAA